MVTSAATITTLTKVEKNNTPLIELQPSSWISEEIRALGTSLDVDDLRKVELVGRGTGEVEKEGGRGVVVLVVDGKGKYELLRLFPDGREGGGEKKERRLELVGREEGKEMLPRHSSPVVFFHCAEVGLNCLVFEDGYFFIIIFL